MVPMMGFAASPFALSASYASLLGVNAAYGTGLNGRLPTNALISSEYETSVTPVGATFAIWGPIFVSQGVGTALMASGALPMAPVAPMWMATWACEVVWQLVFASVPLPAKSADDQRKLVSLVPAAGMLVAAHTNMVAAAWRLTEYEFDSSILRACFVDFPTGLNAGWLAAATGIGITLVAQHIPAAKQTLAGPNAGAVLVGLLTAYGTATTLALSSAVPGAALGYAAATGIACMGIEARETHAERVRRTAGTCKWIALASGVVGIGLRIAERR